MGLPNKSVVPSAIHVARSLRSAEVDSALAHLKRSPEESKRPPTRMSHHTMNTLNRATITAIAGILCFSSLSSARQVEDWPYERLLKEADVVVVARAVSTVRSKDKWEASVFESNRFVAFETTFDSAAVLKGELAGSFKVFQFFQIFFSDLPTFPDFNRERFSEKCN